MKRLGFTLIEMLIAVIVLAIVGSTIATAIGGVVNQSYAMERRTLAHWIGQNEIARLRIDLQADPRILPEGRDYRRVFMGEREWDVRTSIIATEVPLLRRVEIDVYELVDGERTGPYDHLIAFVGRH